VPVGVRGRPGRIRVVETIEPGGGGFCLLHVQIKQVNLNLKEKQTTHAGQLPYVHYKRFSSAALAPANAPFVSRFQILGKLHNITTNSRRRRRSW
jgi:hypothetical protein